MGVLESLREWMPRQRWFAGKGHSPRLRLLDAQPDGPATRYLVMDDAGWLPTLYHVPLCHASRPPAELTPVLEAAVVGPDDAGRVLLDAPRDPRYAADLLARFGVEALPGGTRVLGGEQSNTSLVCATVDGPPVVVKLYRVLHHGENPDVTGQAALSSVGSRDVPRFVGQLGAIWPDIGRTDGVAAGTVAFAQEFVPDARPAWEVALDAARRGEALDTAAAGIGAGVARIHHDLARALPTRPADEDDRAAITGAWDRRLRIALAEVPGLAEAEAGIAAVYARAATESWPTLQRIHGDLHLGQVLAVPGGGWRFIDFEGEPMRPMAERSAPDLAPRDVAGMLRSFDYAAGAALGPGADPAWARSARAAFLAGYASERGDAAASGPLGEALELDKAVYEAIYESRNRPAWLPIPLAGIAAILARGGTA
ncbi:MAG: hypothetical protein J0G30_02000 [Actinomycetales bacterium]|nr:hypothetical protein [Actinomycetales bacterium]